MKLLSILFLLITLTLTAQTITYQTDNSVISNPEKGFYHYTSTGSSGGYNLLNQATVAGYRTTENITIIQRQFFLRDFITGIPINDAYIANMQTDFNRIRAGGAKVIVRFTYTSSSSYTVFQPTKARILFHMKQLVNVLNTNKDVIVSIQAGFIGKYGEWYYTGSSEFGDGDYTQWNNTQWTNRKDIVDYMLNNFPKEVPLQLRYVYAKQRMYGNSYVGRIGFFNDAFLNQWGDSGTFLVSGALGTPSTTDIAYWQTQTTNNPVSGETDAVNIPRTGCTNAIVEMNKYNWSFINKDYFTTVISDWQNVGCYATMQKSLGYDFRLNTSTINNGFLTINIGNYGYANLFKARRALIVCKNTSTNVNYSYILDANLRGITTTSYNMTVNIANLGLPIGQYKLFLSLPDPILVSNPNYAIRCSNLNTWTAEGFNDLLINYTVSTVVLFNKTITVENEQITSVKVYSYNGPVVSTSVDLSDLPSGLYIAVIKTISNRTITKKIIL